MAGIQVGNILEGFMKFDLVVRFPASETADAEAIGKLLVSGKKGELIPLKHLAFIKSQEGPAEVSRENAQRLITVEASVRNRGIGSFVREAQTKIDDEVRLPTGYTESAVERCCDFDRF